MRLVSAFLRVKERVLTALRDDGGLFELRFLRGQVEREQAQVLLASRQAGTIDTRLGALRAKIERETSPGDDTPGILDARESAEILHELTATTRHAHAHATTLDRLV